MMELKEGPGESRMERKKEETKKRVLTVTMDLISRRGYDGTTMEQIAREADIAKGTLYNYFPVKEAIIDEYIRRAFREKNSERMAELRRLPDTRSRMVKIFSELVEGVQRGREFFEKYIVYRMQNMVSFHQDEAVKSGFNLIAVEIIKLGQQSGEIRQDLPLYVLEDLLEYSFIAIVKQFYIDPDNFKARQAIEQCVELFMNGVKPEDKKKF